MEKEEIKKIVKDLRNGRFKLISKEKISEIDLLEISERLKDD